MTPIDHAGIEGPGDIEAARKESENLGKAITGRYGSGTHF
jgi:hypothetical protein